MRKALVFALLLCAPGANAQVRPDATWRQLESQNFRVVFEAGLDSLARHAAAIAEHEYRRLHTELIPAPRGKIGIIIADNTDLTNGLARPFPDNRIVIWVRPPVDELSLANYTDWIELVISHELTHIFHHDQAGRLGRALRTVFGRLPLGWPVFPVIGIPRWNSEGLATHIESEHTGEGRVYGSYHEMVLRTAILEDKFPTIDRVSGETPIWPGGTRAYIYGSLFMDYITRRYGEQAQTELIRKTKGSILPPPWRMNRIAKRALGESYSDLYRDWRDSLRHRYRALSDSLAREGITQTEQITTTGRYALHPRISHDNTRLAYTDENGRDVFATRIIELGSGDDERNRRNGIAPVAWLPDNRSYVTTQFEFVGPYEIYSDLYLIRDGDETRLTKGQRVESVHVTRDGERVVYVQNARGSNRLVVRDLDSGAERILVERSPDVHWILPRWSPDGTRIAAQRWMRGRGHDIAILDENGNLTSEVVSAGLDAAPAWSPDGRYVVFSSDRTGIPNLYAFDTTNREIKRITNVLTGALFPEVTPDGSYIYFSGYHADGFHIERIAYDPQSWRTAPADPTKPTERADRNPVPAVMLRASRKYSPIPSALPKFWFPYFRGDTATGQFTGVFTAGEDDVGRHSYVASLEYGPRTARVGGDLTYSWAGLGNPVLTFNVARIWKNDGWRVVRDAQGNVTDTLYAWEREDRIGVTATLSHRRWRRGATVLLGAEGAQFTRRLVGNARFRDPEDKMIGVLTGLGFSSTRLPAQSISLEDGVRAHVIARRRFELDPAPAPSRDQSYTEVYGQLAGYRGIPGRSWAHSVLAARVTALHRSDVGPGPTDVGGVYGFMSVRGFKSDERVGFDAWSASAEYRLPVALIGRGVRLFPLFIDRVGGAFFVDAGNATCSDTQAAVYVNCAGTANRPKDMLLSAGFEATANMSLLVFIPSWLRAGVAFPLVGGEKKAQFYLTAGPSF